MKTLDFKQFHNYREIIEFANSINLQKEDYLDIKQDMEFYYLLYYKTK